jgi:hypothetical protein
MESLSARLRHLLPCGRRGSSGVGVQSAKADFPKFQPPVSTGGRMPAICSNVQ